MTDLSTSSLSLARVPRSKLAEQVAKQLLGEIRGKGLEPGTRMPSERELMAALGVGRSTVREAINGLAMLGMLEVRHGQGVFVAAPDPERGADPLTAALAHGVTSDLLEARAVVAPEIARLAAQRRTDEELAALVEAAGAADRFELALARAAHSTVLAGFAAALAGVLAEHAEGLAAQDGHGEWELAQHRGVLDAVRTEDADEAAARMSAYVAEAARRHERVGLA